MAAFTLEPEDDHDGPEDAALTLATINGVTRSRPWFFGALRDIRSFP
jgi:hypothetical protein